MPSLRQLVAAMRQYRRYQLLSAYVDDVDELRDGTFLRNDSVKLFRAPPSPVWHLGIDEELLTVHLHAAQGLVQLRLQSPSPTTTLAQALTDEGRAELETILGRAATLASQAKQGQLGDLVLCMMIGNHVGGPAGPVGLRIFTIQHNRADDCWRAYDGPMLAWAKEHLVHDPT